MITAKTITDEQIRELLADALDRGDRDTIKTTQIALGWWDGSHAWLASSRDYTPACAHVVGDDDGVALECGSYPDASIHTRSARARCAEILNAREQQS